VDNHNVYLGYVRYTFLRGSGRRPLETERGIRPCRKLEVRSMHPPKRLLPSDFPSSYPPEYKCVFVPRNTQAKSWIEEPIEDSE
jgi:hypothetical protein